MERVWVGIDVGKEFHWAHVLDASGRKLLSRRLGETEKTSTTSLLGMPRSTAAKALILRSFE